MMMKSPTPHNSGIEKGMKLSHSEFENLKTDVSVIKAQVTIIDANVKEILQAMNGPKGTVAQTEVNRHSVIKLWSYVGGLTAWLSGLCFWLLKAPKP